MTKRVIMLDLPDDLEHVLFGPDLIERLNGLGEVRRARDTVGTDRLGSEILVTGWGSAPLPDRLPADARLRLLVHSAGTVRELVPKSLIEEGVRVSHAPDGMAQSVAELAMYFTASLLRSLYRVDQAMRIRHDWREASSFGLGSAIAQTRIGVIGASRVGRAYIRLLVAYGADIRVYDPYLSDDEASNLGVQKSDLEDLLRWCRVVALHAPVTHETALMLSGQRLTLLQDGAALVNTARSALLDMDALLAELRDGRISAALDVFDDEPLPPSSPLWELPNVILTPHVGAVTTHSRRAQGQMVVEEITRYVHGKALQAEISTESYDRLA